MEFRKIFAQQYFSAKSFLGQNFSIFVFVGGARFLIEEMGKGNGHSFGQNVSEAEKSNPSKQPKSAQVSFEHEI